MKLLRGSVLLLLVMALTGSQLWGQYPHVREGFWATVAVGYGGAKISCDQCGSLDREGQVSGMFALGAAASKSLMFGIEIAGWSKNLQGGRAYLGTGTAMAKWYPQERGGLFVKGGVGLGYLDAFSGSTNNQIPQISKAGFGYQVGVGYDLRVDWSISVSPVVIFSGGELGSVSSLSGIGFNMIQALASITFH